jgi:trigger factor
MDEKAFRDSFREQAEKQVKVRLTLEAIAKKEKIAPSDEELEAEYAKFAEQYGMEVEQVKAAIPATALVEDLSVSKAMDFVKEHATITEE